MIAPLLVIAPLPVIAPLLFPRKHLLPSIVLLLSTLLLLFRMISVPLPEVFRREHLAIVPQVWRKAKIVPVPCL